MDAVPLTPRPARVPRRFDLGLRVALVVVMIAGVGFAVALAHVRPLWLDEVLWIDESARSSYEQMILHYRSQDPNHPPLSFLLLKVSMDVAGSDAAWVARLISLLAGMACVPVAYLLGRQCHSGLFGLCGAAGMACAPLQVDQAAQAKDFSLLSFFTLLALLATVALLRDRARSFRRAGWLGLALGAGLWNSQLELVTWAAAAVSLGALLVLDRSRRQLLVCLTAAGVAALVGLPGLLDLFGARLRPAPAGPSLLEIVQEIRYSLPVPLPAPWRWLGLAAALGGLLWLARRQGLVALPLIGQAVFALLFAYALRQRHPFFTARYLMPLLPALWFGLAAYAVLPGRSAARQLAAAGLLLVLGTNLAIDGTLTTEWRNEYEYGIGALVRDLGREVRPGDRLYFSPAYTAGLGRYARLPVAEESPRETADKGDTGSGAWLVAVRVISPEEAEGAREDAVCLARRYGRELDAKWLAANFGAEKSAAVRVGPDGVSYYVASGGGWGAPAQGE